MAKLMPLACGVTTDFTPSVVLRDEEGNTFPLWNVSGFQEINDALEFLKDIYANGVDIDDGAWLNIEELREYRK